jgi:signal transduction histidine kinase/ligand-binding sensor domain-containing protein
MPAEAQGLVVHVRARGSGVRVTTPGQVATRGLFTFARHLRSDLAYPLGFSASCGLKINKNIRGPRRFFLSLTLFFLLIILGLPLFAFDTERTIRQFAHTAWGAKEDCPRFIVALAQTKDGYLWLGTRHGLFRFDGVSFERYVPPPGTALPALAVSSLLALDNGDLWIGFRSGHISLLRDGKLGNYGTHEGVPNGIVMRLVKDRGGTIWAASTGGLARLEGERWQEVGEDWDYPGKSAFAAFLDRQGTLWVSTENTVVFLPAGARKFQPTGIRIGQVWDFSQAANGRLWMAETTNSVRPVPLRSSQPPSDDTEIRVGSQGILFDRDGALWITSIGDGMRRAPAPDQLHGSIAQFSDKAEIFTAKDGLSGDDVRAILQDREGTIWVGTVNGLDRFRKTNVVPFPLPINPGQTALAAGNDGDLWVDSLGSIFLVRGMQATAKGLKTKTPTAVYRDPAGVIWWASAYGLYPFRNGRYSKVALPREITRSYTSGLLVAGDHSGTLWVANDREGLFYLKKGVWRRLPIPQELVGGRPFADYTDWTGQVWFAYAGGAIITVNPAQVHIVASNDQAPVGSVRSIQGRDRHIWVGGESGLALFDGSRFRAVVPGDRKTFENVTSIAELSDSSLWLGEERGIVHIPAPEIRKALEDPSYRVHYELFDSFDGLPGNVASGLETSAHPGGNDNLLWFLTANGIAWLSPTKVFKNTVPPPVSITSVTAAGRQYTSPTELKLQPRTENLQIAYTALSLVIPERVRFRYRLEGVDKEWQDAGTRREAFYTQLGPGTYRFRVIACNNDGVWNEQGAALDFSIAPAWYQTAWFRSSCVALSLLFLWALYRLRLYQLERQFNIGLEARVNERTRIARELHDTLLQSFQGLLLRFQAVSNLLPSRPDEAKRRLDGAIDQTAQAITEGRDAVHELRSCTGPAGDLDGAIRALGEQLIADYRGENSSTFRLQVEGTPRELQPILRDEVYRIAGEALRNAFRHAEAGRIETEIRYDESRLRLRVRDDGKGIDPKLLNQEGQPGHWGLPGMRERAKLIGGRLDVWSELEAGTEVELSVPSSLAYATSRSPSRPLFVSWLARVVSRREKG